jgi:formate hydrogenlyase transcriptional activator
MELRQIEIGTRSDAWLRFESLLIEISSQFVDLPPDKVDDEIERAQGRICDHLDLDRSTLWQQPVADPSVLSLTHVYQRPGCPAVPAQADGQTLFPWGLRQLQRGETIVLSDLDDLPAEAARDKESWRRFGTVSTVIVPLSIGGVGFGGLSFASLRQRREWSETLLKQLRLIAQVFASALHRARSEKELRESVLRFRQVAEVTNDFIWEVDAEGLYTYTSPSVQKILGYAPEELVGKMHFYDLFAPDVREDLKAAAFEGFAARRPLKDFYNLNVGKNGRTVHLETGGVPLLDASGNLAGYRGADTDVTARKEAEGRLRHAYEELKELRDQLQQQNVYLRQEVKTLHGHSRLVGQSRPLRDVLLQAEQVAATGSTVLLLGETGTGKELIASTIHEMSPRRDHVMVRVNCSAIPASLIESELFGREKGAYTGALSRQIGRFETAHKSTLFLDEIGDLPTEVQVKLLRVLQERQIERLGSSKPIEVDVRIIAATNKDLDKAVREGIFRQDLYYRLNVFPIKVPPLRERREDIPPLVSAFVAEFGVAYGKSIESISKDSMEKLRRYPWPGNVRELRNVIERAMIVAKGSTLRVDLPDQAMCGSTPSLNIWENEANLILNVLQMTGWRIRGRNGAAEILGLKPTTLESRMTKLGIRRGNQDATK